MRLERRDVVPPQALVLAPLTAVAVTLAVCALLVAWAGAPVGRTYALLFEGAFGSRFALTETLTRATPLMLTGMATAVAFRARFFNIGAEGQLYLGALAAVAVGGLHDGSGFDLPVPLHVALMILAGMVAGGALVLGPALMKVRLGVDEVVTTLLLNFIVLLLVSLMLDGPMKDPGAMGWPQSVGLKPELEFTRLIDKARVHSGLLIAIGLAVLTWAVQRFTTWGFEWRSVGESPAAARFIGIPVNAVLLRAALISGAFAGLAGVSEVAGRAGYLTLDMSPGYGYAGIVIAMLAALNPLGVVLASIFIAGMLVGADGMTREVPVPSYIADVIVAVALISMLVATMLARYRIRRG